MVYPFVRGVPGLMGTDRLGVYEHGVCAYWGLKQWNRVKDFTWADGGVLIEKSSGLLAIPSRGALPVPIERIDEFKRLFAEGVSSTDTT